MALKFDEQLSLLQKPDRAEMTDEEWGGNTPDAELISRRILITKPSVNGKKFSDLRLRTKYGITLTRVNRAGVDLIPHRRTKGNDRRCGVLL